MRIIICDDQSYVLDEIYNIIEQWMDENRIDGSVKCFTNPLDIFKHLDWADALLLDVEMPEIDGFSVAERIRNSGYDCPIAFLTSHKERVQEAFKVKAFRYLYKPVNPDELKECLHDILRDISNKIIIIGEIPISLNDVTYIEALGEGVAIHTLNNNNFISKSTLKDINNKLPYGFFQCHKSYIVNFKHIASFEKNNVIFTNRIRVPLATRKNSEIKTAYKMYVVKYARII